MQSISTTAVYTGDSILAEPPQYMIHKALYLRKINVKPMIALYDSRDVDNARRYLIEPGFLDEPIYWNPLPALPGCLPMNNSKSMCEAFSFLLNRIIELDPTPMVLVSVAGRASSFLTALSIILGFHVRVGLEDTIFLHPHKDDILESTAQAVGNAIDIVHSLGLQVASADDHRKYIGIKKYIPPKIVK